MHEDFKILSLITVILAGSLFAVLVADDVLRVDFTPTLSRAADSGCPNIMDLYQSNGFDPSNPKAGIDIDPEGGRTEIFSEYGRQGSLSAYAVQNFCEGSANAPKTCTTSSGPGTCKVTFGKISYNDGSWEVKPTTLGHQRIDVCSCIGAPYHPPLQPVPPLTFDPMRELSEPPEPEPPLPYGPSGPGTSGFGEPWLGH